MEKIKFYRQITAITLLLMLLSIGCMAGTCIGSDPADCRTTLGGITYNGYGQVVSYESSGDYAQLAIPVATPASATNITKQANATQNSTKI